MTQTEVEKAFGLTGNRPVHNLLKRERKKELQGVPKSRGRKPAKTLQEYKYENKRLKMEVELLRDFLSLTERMWERNLSTRLSTVTGKSIPSRSCASSLACPEAVTTAMWSGWDLLKKILCWQKSSGRIRSGVVRPTVIAGCTYGWKAKASTAIRKLS